MLSSRAASRITSLNATNVWARANKWVAASTVKPFANLGQGFPDEIEPWVESTLAAAAHNFTYTRGLGAPSLVAEVAQFASRKLGREVDAMNEVLVTAGATEALMVSMLALVEPGSEVVIFEPNYDAYGPQVKLAGGVPRYVRLQSRRALCRADVLSASFMLTPLSPR